MKSSSEDEDSAAQQILDGMSDKLIKKVWNNLPRKVKEGIKDPNPMEAVMNRMRSMRDVVPNFSTCSIPGMPSSSSEVNVDTLVEEANNYIKNLGTPELLAVPRTSYKTSYWNSSRTMGSHLTRHSTPPIIGFTKNAQTLTAPDSQFNTSATDQSLAVSNPVRPSPPNHDVGMPDICFDTIQKPKITEIFGPKVEKYSKAISKQLAEVDKYSVQLEQCMNKKKVLIASIAKLHGKALNMCRIVHQMESDITKIKMQVCGTYVFKSGEKNGPCGNFCCKGIINKIVDLQHKLEKVRSRAMLKGCFLAMCEAAENRIQNENIILKKDIKRATEMAKELTCEFQVIRKVVCRIRRSCIKQPIKTQPSKRPPSRPGGKVQKAINYSVPLRKNSEWSKQSGQQVSDLGSTWYFSGGSSGDETDIQNQYTQNYQAESTDSEEFLKQVNNALAESSDQSDDESIKNETRYRKRAGSESSGNPFQTPPQSDNESDPPDLDEILNTDSDEEIRMVSFTITTSSSHRSSKSPETKKAQSQKRNLRDNSKERDKDTTKASTSKQVKRISRKEAARKEFCECGQIIKGIRCSCGKKARRNISVKPQEHVSDAESAKSYLMSVINYNESQEQKIYPTSIPGDKKNNKAYVVKPLSPNRPKRQQEADIESSKISRGISTEMVSKRAEGTARNADRSKANQEKRNKFMTDEKCRKVYTCPGSSKGRSCPCPTCTCTEIKPPQTNRPTIKSDTKKVVKTELPNNCCICQKTNKGKPCFCPDCTCGRITTLPPKTTPSTKPSRKPPTKSKKSENVCICSGIPGPCKCPGCSCEASRDTLPNESILEDHDKKVKSSKKLPTGKCKPEIKEPAEKGSCICYISKGKRPCQCPDCDCESDSSENAYGLRNGQRQRDNSSQKVNVCICTGKEGPCECPNCSCQSIITSGETNENPSKSLQRKSGISNNKVCICFDNKGEIQCRCPDCKCESDTSEKNKPSDIISRESRGEQQKKGNTIRNVCICTGIEGPCECPNCSCQSIANSVRISINTNEDGPSKSSSELSRYQSEQVEKGTCICYEKKGEHLCPCPECTCKSKTSASISEESSEEKLQQRSQIGNICICTGKEGPCECPQCSCQSIKDSVRRSIPYSSEEEINERETQETPETSEEKINVKTKDKGKCLCPKDNKNKTCVCPNCTCIKKDVIASEKSEDSVDVSSTIRSSITEEQDEDDEPRKGTCKCPKSNKGQSCKCPDCTCGRDASEIISGVDRSTDTIDRKKSNKIESKKSSRRSSRKSIHSPTVSGNICTCTSEEGPCKCLSCSCSATSKITDESGNKSKQQSKESIGQTVQTDSSANGSCTCSVCPLRTDKEKPSSSTTIIRKTPSTKEPSDERSRRSSKISRDTIKKDEKKPSEQSSFEKEKVTPEKEGSSSIIQRDSLRQPETDRSCTPSRKRDSLHQPEIDGSGTPSRNREMSPAISEKKKKDPSRSPSTDKKRKESGVKERKPSTSQILDKSEEDYQIISPRSSKKQVQEKDRLSKKSDHDQEVETKGPSRSPSTDKKRRESGVKERKPSVSQTVDKSEEEYKTISPRSSKKQVPEKDTLSKKSDHDRDDKTKSKSHRSTEASSNESLQKNEGIIQEIIPQDPLTFETDDESFKKKEGGKAKPKSQRSTESSSNESFKKNEGYIQEIIPQDPLPFENDDDSSKKNEGIIHEIIPQDPLNFETDDETEIRSTKISPKDKQKESTTSITPKKSQTSKLPEKGKRSTYEVVVTEIPDEKDDSSRRKSKSKTFDVAIEPLDRKGSESRSEMIEKKPSRAPGTPNNGYETPRTPSKSKPSKPSIEKDKVFEKDISRRSSKRPSRLPSASLSKPSIGRGSSPKSFSEDNIPKNEILRDRESQSNIKKEKSLESRRKPSKAPSKQPSKSTSLTEVDKSKISKQPSIAPSTRKDDKDKVAIPSQKGEQSRRPSSKAIEKPMDETLIAPPPSRKPSSVFREEITKTPERAPSKQPSFYSEERKRDKSDKEPEKHISRRSSKAPSIRFENDVEDKDKANKSPSGKQIPSKVPPAENGQQDVRGRLSQDQLSTSSILTIMRDCQEKLRGCQAENEQLDFQRKSTAAQIQRLQDDLESCRKNYEDCLAGKVSDRSVLKEIASLQNENTKLKQEIDSLKVIANKLEITNDILKEENDKLKAGRQQMPIENDRAPMDCLPFIEKIAKLESQIVTFNLEKDNLLREYADCKGKLASKEEQLNKCLKDLETTHHDISEEIVKPIQTTDCTEWIELAHKYEAKLKDYRIRSVKSALLAEISAKQRDDLKHEVAELSSALKNAQEDLTKCLADNTTGPLQSQIALMQDELAKYKDAVSQYEASNSRLLREKEDIAGDFEAVERKLKKCEDEIQNITKGDESYIAQQYTKLRTENNELIAEVDNKKREIERLNLNLDWCNKRWAECKSKLESYEAKIGIALRENKDNLSRSDATIRSAKDSDKAGRFTHEIIPYDPETGTYQSIPNEMQPGIERRSSKVIEKERSHSTKVDPNDPNSQTKLSLPTKRDPNLEREIKEHFKDVQLSKKMYKFLQTELQKVVHKLNSIPCCENVQDELVKIYLAIDWMRTRICRCYPDPREFHFSPKCVEGSDPVLHGICLQIVIAGVRSLNLRQLMYLHCTVYKVGSEFAKTNCFRFNCKQFGVVKQMGRDKDKRKRKKMAVKKLKRLETEMDNAKKLLCNLKEFCKGQPTSETHC